ncbi:MAG: glycosyltransferase family 4 protein [Thermodesulfobacteriota bacterium]
MHASNGRLNFFFISNLYPPNAVGGYERLCHENALALSARGHEVFVLTSGYGSKKADYPGITVDRSLQLLADHTDIYRPFDAQASERERINRHNVDRMQRLVAERKPDIIFAWNLFFLDRSFFDALQETGRRLAFLLTDNWLLCFLRPDFWQTYFTENVLASFSWKHELKSVAARLLAGRGRKRFHIRGRAVFPSRFMRDLYARGGIGFQDAAVIHHGVNLAAHGDSAYCDRGELRRPGCLHLLFAGRVVEMKGVHTILEAMPEILRTLSGHDVRLDILGDAQDRQYLERLQKTAASLNIQDRIRFLPPVPESSLFDLFQQYDLYLFPSLYEPFSLTLIHALEAGIPTVSSSAGGNPEIIFHGRTGMLFSKGDAASLAKMVVQLARSGELRRRISATARTVSREFTFTRMIERIEEYMKRV